MPVVSDAGSACYQLAIGEQSLPLNGLLGKQVNLRFSGKIFCQNCGRATKKSYSEGHCFPCSQKLASCDLCIMKPETCHFAKGTCREPEWAQSHCMVPHFVYLANSSALKVGITRHTQIPTRWLDQGAVQGMLLFQTQTRHIAGLVEVAIAKQVADKTNWRKLLQGQPEPLALAEIKAQIQSSIVQELSEIRRQFGEQSVQAMADEHTQLQYPVRQYPSKIVSWNLDKEPELTGVLMGIKGQYWLLDHCVINIRKYTGYEVQFSVID